MPEPVVEPGSARVRPTPMLRTLLAVPALAVLAACGSAPSGGSAASGSGSSTSSATPSVSSSPTPALCTDKTSGSSAQFSSMAGVVDLDGDGRPETVSIRQGGSGCTGALTTTVGGHHLSTAVGNAPVAGHGLAIQVPGRTGQLLALRATNPRGGSQLLLFGYADGRLAELTSDGKPLLPFVATDTPGTTTPLTATCGHDAITVVEGRPHAPAGVAFAWDLYRTTYAIDGNAVTAGPATKVADNVLPDQLAAKQPAAAHHRLFTSCVAATTGGAVKAG